jgi:hypothetical protein
MKDNRFEIVKGSKCQLRGEFHKIEGNLEERQVVLIDEKENEKSEYKIIIFQTKIAPIWIYVETVFINKIVFSELKKFLKDKIKSIPAKGFSNVPDGYRHYFQTENTLFPILVEEIIVEVPNIGNGGSSSQKTITREKVDFDSPCILQMVRPNELFNKIDELEENFDFDSQIAKPKFTNDTMVQMKSFEIKKNSKHIIFRG